MHFLSTLLALAATVDLAAAACGAYPRVDTKLSACPTVTAFCESFLGQTAVSATTVSVPTYTTTMPAKTVRFTDVSSATTRTSITLPTGTFYVTSVVCSSTIPGKRYAEPFPTPEALAPVPALGASCGVGGYPKYEISQECSCFVDPTVTHGGTTKTVRHGTTLFQTSATRTSHITDTSYLTTVTATAYEYFADCPPINASCANPGVCGDYNFYVCGSNGYEECVCGYDTNNLATCFQSGPCDVTCSTDSDCGFGEFCLVDSCCGENICAPLDVCEGDQVSTYIYGPPTATPEALAMGKGDSAHRK